jgi:hypothetical protein
MTSLRSAKPFHCDGEMEKHSERLNQNESNLLLGVAMATKVYSVEGGRWWW